jgi:hypothetical protein
MARSKFPTPDEPTGTDKVLVGLFVDSEPVSLSANLSGAISLLFEEYFFEKYGEMTPERAAEYYRNLDMVTDFCAHMVDCLQNSESFRSELNKYIGDTFNIASVTNITNPLLPSDREENLLPAGYTCSDAALMGMSRFLVQGFNIAVQEVFQSLEGITNPLELVGVLIDNVEGISWIGSLYELAVWAQDQLAEVYNAAYTLEIEDYFTCRLFCYFRDDCLVSFDTIHAAYADILAEDSIVIADLDNLDDVVDIFLTLDSLPARAVVSVSHRLMLEIIKFRGSWGGFFGLRGIESYIQQGLDEVDNSYGDCLPCFPVIVDYDYNFGINAQGFTSYSNASWSTGAWRVVNDDNAYTITLTFPSDKHISAFDVQYRNQWGCSGHNIVLECYDAGMTLLGSASGVSVGTGVTGNAWLNDIDVDIEGVRTIRLRHETSCINNARAIFYLRLHVWE